MHKRSIKSILHESEEILAIFKQSNLIKDAVKNLDQSWRTITSKNIRKSRTWLWPDIKEPGDSDIPLSEHQKKLCPISREGLKKKKSSNVCS